MISKEFKEYTPEAVEQIKQLLVSEAKSGSPMPFEIKVDGFIKIRKTDKVERFNELYSFLDDTTEQLVITLFIDPTTDKKEWYKFRLKQAPSHENLNGVDMDAKLNEKLKAYDLEQEQKRTREELSATKAKLESAEEYIGMLLNQIEESKAKPNHIGKWDMGKLFGTMVEGIAINYPKVLTDVPVLNGIAKVIQSENKNLQIKQPNNSFEGDVSFKLKDDADNQQPDEHLQAVKNLADFITAHFDEDQRRMLGHVIEALGMQPDKLETIADLLNVNEIQE